MPWSGLVGAVGQASLAGGDGGTRRAVAAGEHGYAAAGSIGHWVAPVYDGAAHGTRTHWDQLVEPRGSTLMTREGGSARVGAVIATLEIGAARLGMFGVKTLRSVSIDKQFDTDRDGAT